MPFISQAALNTMDKALYNAREDLVAARLEVRSLTETIVTLKRQGYHPPEPVGTMPHVVPANPVQRAINDLPFPRGVKAGIAASAEKWRKEGLSETNIVLRVQMGEDEWERLRAG